jgi:(S)-ureidoglycine aminohydrolase
VTAHLISPAVGANFAMYLANMGANSSAAAPAEGVERFFMVLDGVVRLHVAEQPAIELRANQFAYLPASLEHAVSSASGAGLVLYERRCALPSKPPGRNAAGRMVHGDVDEQPVQPVPGEVFALRKLLPQTAEYDFNVHVMDFLPGEHLNVKEVHYNQHGLLLLEGKGVYRLADEWMPVQAGDAIWMAPYVVQWYAALGAKPSRYLLYKDTTLDPLTGSVA